MVKTRVPLKRNVNTYTQKGAKKFLILDTFFVISIIGKLGLKGIDWGLIPRQNGLI